MNVKTLVKRGQFEFEKNKGLIFTLLSAGFEIAAVVSMAKQAPKAEKVLIPANKKVAKIKEELNNTELILNKQIVPEEHKKEMRKIQRQTALQVVKIYSLPIIFTTASLAFMGGSYKVMRDREIALGAAYVTLDKAFKSYRGRIREKLGEEAENKIYRDVREVPVKTTVTDKNGKEKEVEELVNKANSGGVWEVMFDAASRRWSRSGRTNFETLIDIQNQANVILRTAHHLFLYDVLDMLMIPKSCIDKDLLEASKVIGWVYKEDGNNFVSFGISDECNHPNATGLELFENREKNVWLSFNCDGNILTGKHSFTNYLND